MTSKRKEMLYKQKSYDFADIKNKSFFFFSIQVIIELRSKYPKIISIKHGFKIFVLSNMLSVKDNHVIHNQKIMALAHIVPEARSIRL